MPTENPLSITRKHSLGKLRRAHPASGATWNVQVVRGKMTSKCLWHACRALALGMVLMLLGAGMATVGYYANHLSTGHEIRGNATVRIRNESRGLHLNNLSYIGPIVMGFGGFIVVAACVMTFEARDSAAKVVPARLKTTGSSNKTNLNSGILNRRANGTSQKFSRWEHHAGLFRATPSEPNPPPQLDRQALTAALVHFSKTMKTSPRFSPKLLERRLSRSGSVPNLTSACSLIRSNLSPHRKPLFLDHNLISQNRYLRYHHHHHHQHGRRLSKSRSPRTSTSFTHRDSPGSLLHPGILQLQRHALSVDETGPYFRTSSYDSTKDSLTSILVTAESHEGCNLRDRTKRSDTAKRHVLSRQKPIEKDEPSSPKLSRVNARRRSSNTSDVSYSSRQAIYRRTSSGASRTPSIDSRSVQVELHSPEIDRTISPRITRRFNSGQSSTPSVEREFRSQLSICSEPITVRQLSGQSSIEPCVLEESPDFEEKEQLTISSPVKLNQPQPPSVLSSPNVIIPTTSTTIEMKSEISPKQSSILNTKKPRPDNLALDITQNTITSSLQSNNKTTSNASQVAVAKEVRKILHRSNSSRTFYRPKPKPLSEHEQIHMNNSKINIVSGNNNSKELQDDLYDSLRVINERRKTILKSSQSSSYGDTHQEQDNKIIIMPNYVQNEVNKIIHETKPEPLITKDSVDCTIECDDESQNNIHQTNELMPKELHETRINLEEN